jgi:hypothetical protein
MPRTPSIENRELVRALIFPVTLSEAQAATAWKVADNMFEIWNYCQAQRHNYFTEWVKPLLVAIKNASAEESADLKEKLKLAYANAPVYHVMLPDRKAYLETHVKPLQVELQVTTDPGRRKDLETRIKALRGDKPQGRDPRSQAGWLTDMREGRESFRAFPVSWQQECLRALEGGYKSFMELRKNGDTTARPPRQKAAESFCEVQGCSEWSLFVDGEEIHSQKRFGKTVQDLIVNATKVEVVLAPGKILPGGAELRFEVPSYQRALLSKAVKLNKFILSKNRKGFQLALIFALPKPETLPQNLAEIVFVALGASHLAIASHKGEEVIDLWRPDEYWKRLIEEAKRRGVFAQLKSDHALEQDLVQGYATAELIAQARQYASVSDTRKDFHSPGERVAVYYTDTKYEELPLLIQKLFLRPKQKGSKEYEKLWSNIRKMNDIMRAQGLQDQREVVAGKLRTHGVHFMVIEHSPVRGKKGALADTSNKERTGSLGRNWAAQNTGSLTRLRQLLESKVAEWGGTVTSVKLVHYPEGDVREKKLRAVLQARQTHLTKA